MLRVFLANIVPGSDASRVVFKKIIIILNWAIISFLTNTMTNTYRREPRAQRVDTRRHSHLQ